MSPSTILDENREYWSGRAPGYSDVNRLELDTAQRLKWKACLREELMRRFPDPCGLRVLDAGTGPGFFAILLCELGCDVTAIDFTPAMLEKARENAGELAGAINFVEMNAEETAFPDASFDAVISRNLTWNLPHPERAYAEWARILRPGGLLLNFDANWYAFLFDEDAAAAYKKDRENSAVQGITDQNLSGANEDFSVMDGIARRLPLSGAKRPEWDLERLSALGLQPEADEEIWRCVWSDEEKINFASTPMFLIRAFK